MNLREEVMDALKDTSLDKDVQRERERGNGFSQGGAINVDGNGQAVCLGAFCEAALFAASNVPLCFHLCLRAFCLKVVGNWKI